MRRLAAVADPVRDELATRPYYYWLIACIICEYARPASFIPFLRIPFLYSALPLVLFAVQFGIKGLRPPKEILADPLAKVLLFFFGMMAVSIGWSASMLYAWDATKLVMGYVILFWLISRICTTQARLRGIFLTLLGSHLFLLAMNPQVILNPTVRSYIDGVTFLGDGNDFSLSLCIAMPLTFELAMSAQAKWKKFLGWGAVAILLFAIVASQSRGATIGLAGVLFYIWLYSSRKGLALVGVLLAVACVFIYAPPEYFTRMNSISNYQDESSAMARINAWKAAGRMAADNPLLGVGVGQFPSEYGGRYRPKDDPGGKWMTAHSSYFLVLGELGYTGLFLLLTLIIGGIVTNLKTRARVRARAGPEPTPAAEEGARILYLTTAAMIGFALPGAFLSAAYYPHIYILTALLLCARANALAATGMSVAEAFSKGPPGRGRGSAAAAKRGARSGA
jgi:putative inorganic carbon (hco3(-)) transporter